MFDLIKENVKHIQNANSPFYKEKRIKRRNYHLNFYSYYIILYSILNKYNSNREEETKQK